MMNIDGFISTLREKDIKLWLDGDALNIDAPEGSLSEDDVDELREHKPAIISFLRHNKDDASAPPIARADRRQSLPLSHAQQRLWFIEQLEGSSGAYHIAAAVRLRGALDRAALKATFDALVERHEVLRTTFAGVNGNAVQVIGTGSGFALQTIDLSNQSAEGREAAVSHHVTEEARAPFDLSVGPLLRGRLLRLSEQEHALLVTMHHIVSDGWSMGILMREVAALYAAYRQGLPNPLEPLSIQYADYAVWQRQWLHDGVLTDQLRYWKAQLTGARPMELPTDRMRPAARSFKGATYGFGIPKTSAVALEALANKTGATLYMTVLAAFQVLLARLSGQGDVIVSTAIAGRTHPQIEGLIGFFVNALLMRTQVAGGSFVEHLQTVKETALDAYAHQDVPFDSLVAQLHSERAGLGTALARVAFTLQNAVQHQFALPGLTLEAIGNTGVTAKTDLSLIVHESDRGLWCVFEYATDLFDANTIERFAARFSRLVEQIVAQPATLVDDFDLTLSTNRLDVNQPMPLSAAQRAMWLDLQAHPEKASYYSIVEVVDIAGPLDPALFEQATQYVVNCTASLRLKFTESDDGLLTQEILPERQIEVPLVDCSTDPDPQAAAHAWIEANRHCRLNLVKDTPFLYALLKVSEANFIWYRQYHHLIIDGIGQVILRERISKAYEALRCGQVLPPTADDTDYLAHLHVDAEYRYTPQYSADVRYWRTNIDAKDSEANSLSVRSTTEMQGDAIRVARPLSGAVALALKGLASEAGVSFSRFMIATVVFYLHKALAANRLTIGLPTHGRFDETARNLIAACSNIAPIQFDIDAEGTVGELVANVGSRIKATLQHGRHRNEDIRRLLGIRPHDPALFCATVNVLPYLDAMNVAGIAGEVRAFPRYENGLIVWVEYSSDYRQFFVQLDGSPQLYEPWELQRHVDRLGRFLESVAESNDLLTRKVSALSLLDESEYRCVVDEFNATTAAGEGDKCIHELIEAQVERSPGAVAVVFGEERVSYGELNRRANQLAHYLRQRGVGPDRLVGLCVERGVEMVVGLLGILKAGGGYVPLDASYPRERLEYMLQDAAPVLVLTQGRLKEALPSTTTAVIALDDEWNEIAKCEPVNLDAATLGLHSRHLAYVMYTSGSTGKPKGVMVEHANVVNHNLFVCREFALSASDRALQFATYCFDASVEEIYPTLMAGATLVLRSDAIPTAEELSRQILQERITVLNLPTAYWQLWLTTIDADVLARSALRLVVVGGEKVSVESFRAWHRIAGADIRWLNTYGPTEATVSCTAYCPVGDASDLTEMPIGRPISNAQIYILDGRRQPTPIGVVGELYIGGAGVARGYLNREELTAERFIADPFSSDGAARMYKTGDLGRWLPDGTIEYLGRADHQVKIRGFRIELGEIESQLCRHPQVKEAVVVAREDVPGEKRLVAYLTATQAMPSIDELRNHLKDCLPEYMLPVAFVQLQSLPLTPNGKVDRKGLPAPELDAHATREFAEPHGEIEQTLATIWQELLHLDRIGRHDNFFELGGHSLLAVQAVTQIRQGIGREIALRQLFEYPTIYALARQVAGANTALLDEIDRADRTQPLPLSYAQQRLWFIDQLQGGGAAYHMPSSMRLVGPLDSRALQAAWKTISERHEILRTVFSSVDGNPVQQIRQNVDGGLRFADLSHELPADRIRQINSCANVEATTRFDLSRGPLIRGLLLSVSEQEHVLFITMHHIASDGWSMGVLIREMATLYRAYRDGEENPLSPLPIQYADYAVWQRAWLREEAQQNQLGYWIEHLADAPTLLELPTNRPRPAAPSYRGGNIGFALSPELTAQIRKLARRHKTTLFMTIYTGFAIVLSKLSGQADIVVGAPVANRQRGELEGLIGFFANTLALRIKLEGDDSVGALLAKVRSMVLGGYSHQDVPFEQVVEAIHPTRSLSHSPVFQVMLSLQNIPQNEIALSGLTLAPQETGGGGVAKFDLSLIVQEDGERIVGSLNYASDLFDRATIARWVGYFRTVLTALVQDSEQRVSAIDMLNKEERQQLLHEFNATQAKYAQDKLIHELFEEQVSRSPDAIAVCFEDQQLSYRDLNGRANQLARYLRTQGVRPDGLVAICVERGIEMVVGLLGILKAGGAYVPLDPSYPAERLEYMLKDAAPKVVLTQGRLRASLPTADATIIAVDSEWSAITTHADGNLDAAALKLGSKHLAYVIYTSGSTGQPKGVMNEHGGVVNRLRWMQDAYRLTAEDRVLQKTPFSFDVSVWEFFWTLLNGARLVMARPQGHQDPGYLRDVIQTAKITTVHFVPSMLQVFLEQGEVEQCSSLRQVVCSGEELSAQVQNRCLERLPQTRLHNLYGPTEAAIDVTYWECGLDPSLSRVPIGRPIANTQMYILDRHLQPVPLGVVGEIYIGGAGVARGYLNRPELTAERFIQDPFSNRSNSRLYKSGDVGRYRPDGAIEYLGRNDHQVKIRGFRIELGEIESQLAQYPSIRDAVVLAREDVPGEKRLVAYVTHTDAVPSSEELRAHLLTCLPEYMVPSAYVVMETFPLTPNGKLDRKVLPTPELGAYSLKQYEAPQGEIEQTLATLWQELLQVERVGRHDNFFELGGHSLLAVRLISRTQLALGRALTLRGLFESPTIALLADAAARQAIIRQEAIARTDRSGRLPLSHAQQRLWFIDQLEGGSAAYHIPAAVRLSGQLDEGALRRSLDALIERHEVLRTAFGGVDDNAVQVIGAATGFALQVIDLSDRSAEARAAAVSHQVTEEARAPFNLSVGPLIRGRLIRLSDDEHALLITMHHIVSDGWSMGILMREVAALYAAYRQGLPNPLEPLSIQYADYAVWQRQWLHDGVLTDQLRYWKAQLTGARPMELPTDRMRPAARSFKGATYGFGIPKTSAVALEALANKTGATLYMTVLAAFQVLLARLSGQGDVIVSTAIAGRTHPQIEGLIGFFVNALLMRTQVAGGSFVEHLQTVKETALDAYAHQDVPFDSLVAQLHSERAGLGTALARVAFTLQNAVQHQFALPGLTLEAIGNTGVTAKTDLSLIVHESERGLWCVFEYATDLFDANTIETFAARFSRLIDQIAERPDIRIDDLDFTLPIDPEASAPLPLSAAQRAMWLDLQAHPEKASYYSVVEVVEIAGSIDPALFERAIQYVVDCTAALRLRFTESADGLLNQEILPERRIQVPLFDVSTDDNPQAAAHAWLEAYRHRRFNPVEDVPFFYAVLKVSADKYIWYRQYHHLIIDGIGQVILRERISKAYEALRRGEVLPLATDDRGYLAHLHSDAEYRYTPQYAADVRYWQTSIDVEESTACSLSMRSTAAAQGDALRVPKPLSGAVALALKKLASEAGVSFARFMIAAVVLYLHKALSSNRLTVGVPTHGRFDEVTRDLFAVCSNIAPIQFNIAEEATVKDFAQSVGTRLKAALQHGRYRGEDIRRLLGVRPHDPALFNVTINVFSFLDAMDVAGVQGEVRDFSRYESDLLVWVEFSRDYRNLLVQLDGNPQLYEAWELEQHASRLAGFMENLAGANDLLKRKVDTLSLVSESEYKQVIGAFNATATPYLHDKCVHELIEAQVERSPGAVAVVFGEERVSYGELNRRANQLAHYLRQRGVGPDRLVGLCVERGVEMVVGLLGILKAGGGYVPLDASYPRERLEYMLQDAAPVLVLTQGRLKEALPSTTTAVIALDDEWNEIAKCEPVNLDAATLGLHSRHLAYVMYTSGSTGKPKGVMVEHANVVNHNLFVCREFALSASDRALQFATYCFDASVEEIYPTLMAGATLVLRSDAIPTAEELSRQILQERITVLNLPTAYWQLWLTTIDADVLARSALRLVVVGGEKVSVESFRAWHRIAGADIRWLNTYGPTEATVSCTAYCPVGDASDLTEMPIGRPISNAQIYILDGRRQPTPIGVVGELYIGGAGVARGYLNREELTAERFIADPFSSDGAARMYKTGDLGRWLPDGTIEYLGRADHQVKIRGFRIELGEIESQLCRHPQVKEAVVVAREDVPGEKRLVAYLTATQAMPSIDELRNHLKDCLPEYMLPVAFVQLQSLPLTPNGKVDRKGLPAPELDAHATREFAEPHGEIEQTLATIWQELLHLDRIGRHDNFFELGGHSLLAVACIGRLRRAGINVVLVSLFKYPTVAGLANHFLCAQDIRQFDDGAVALREQGAERPLFLVHEITGNVYPFFPLARHIQGDIPVYGLPHNGGTAIASMEALAALHIEAMRKVQPSGPYRIAGHSLGGIVAYEIAAQLTANGAAVEFLGLIDSYRPNQEKFGSSEITEVEVLIMYVEYINRQLEREHKELLSAAANADQALAHCKALRLLPGELELTDVKRWTENINALLSMAFEYSPRPMQVPSYLLSADGKVDDPSRGWKPLLGEHLRVVAIGGTHFSIIQAPHVEKLAHAISEVLTATDVGRRSARSASSSVPTARPATIEIQR